MGESFKIDHISVLFNGMISFITSISNDAPLIKKSSLRAFMPIDSGDRVNSLVVSAFASNKCSNDANVLGNYVTGLLVAVFTLN